MQYALISKQADQSYARWQLIRFSLYSSNQISLSRILTQPHLCLLTALFRVCNLGFSNARRPSVHGRYGSHAAYGAPPLGRIHEQVLRRRGLRVHSIQLPRNRRRHKSCGLKYFLLRQKLTSLNPSRTLASRNGCSLPDKDKKVDSLKFSKHLDLKPEDERHLVRF